VRFESNKYDIKPESFPTLDRLTDNLKNNPKNAVEIHGHADSSGNDAINIPLAKRRAEAVKAYLVGKGIKPNRITTKGFGSSKPIADNATPEGRAKNRRVEIILLTPDF
jgi:outer membrane protein OmpA-like peptidoglycan-associated protein